MKLTTKHSLLHSPMGNGRGSFYFPYTKTTQKPCRMYLIKLLSTWTRKMRCLPKKRSLKSEKGKKMYGRIGDERQQGQETDKRIGVPSPSLGVSQALPRWRPLLIKSWYRSRTRQPWHGLESWKETPARCLKINTVVSTETTVTTCLNVMIWSSR